MSTEAVWITVLASFSTGLFGVVLGQLWSSAREKPRGMAEVERYGAPAIHQRVNINLPEYPSRAHEAGEITKELPDIREILSRLDEIAGRLHQLELQAADSPFPTG